jgi:hypothetical protein
MIPNNTNAKRKIKHFAFRTGANGGRIRNLRAESSRSQVSLLILILTNAISRAGVGDHFRKSSPISGAVWDAVWSRRKSRIMHDRGFVELATVNQSLKGIRAPAGP